METPQINLPQINVQKTVKIAVGVSVIAITYVIVSRKLKKKREQNNRNNAVAILDKTDGKANATRYASLYRSTMKGWGTNEELFFKVTKDIKKTKTPFKEVANAYSKLYNRELLIDIQKELNSTEYAEFMSILKG